MTNKELFLQFQIIENENDNIFDIYCALNTLSEQYQTTEFYQTYATYSVLDAYNLYINSTTSIGSLLRDFKNIDLPAITQSIVGQLDVTNKLDSMDEDTKELVKLMLEQA